MKQPTFFIPEDEVEMLPIRAQGAGGQNVNKVSSAIHLRFDVAASSLPEACKKRLLALRDRRVSSDGVIVIKAQQHRTQEKNRQDALDRLQQLVDAALHVPPPRKPSRMPRGVRARILDSKIRRGRLKKLRRPPEE